MPPASSISSSDLRGEVREVADVEPVVGDQCQQARHHRSISPTLISMLPSVTIASAIAVPTVISLQHAQVDQRRRAHVPAVRRGPPSLTT